MNKAYINWSSGKDAAMALYYARKNNELEVRKLVTSLSADVDRVTMHGVRRELLIEQAHCIGMDLQIIELPANAGMETYNRIMSEATELLKSEDYSHAIFGDIFLEDLRTYREEQLQKVNIQAVFPLWKLNTKELIKQFIDLNFKAIVVCTNSKVLDDSFCGRNIDKEFINDLPKNVDLCGENGEFHTYVYDGPIFKKPVEFKVGEKVKRSYSSAEDEDDCHSDDEKPWDTEFCFCDLLPK
ncbi:diphthine--ammonia ligase [uncultured Christiangramia sp.]|uniref:Dph6-related ATP pyrophosphatase n=1 Tax=uncultured Christiangramia sp. TaxID=503836 RepID=UPI002636F1D1|nr:diphthine--ammonia ligase [uncultured Christiangramia sp.]